MGEGFWVFIFIVFFVLPILERVFKGGVNTKRPPGGLPGQRPVPRRPLPGQRMPAPGDTDMGTAARSEAEADATDLLPAELWEILTGQRSAEPPAPPPPAPAQPAPPPVRARQQPPAWRRPSAPPPPSAGVPAPIDEEAAAADFVRRRDREWQARHTPPAAVSMETEPLSEEKRHAAFHDRVDHLSKPATVQRGRGPLDMHLRGRSALRRAMLMQEVLGRPKGLED